MLFCVCVKYPFIEVKIFYFVLVMSNIYYLNGHEVVKTNQKNILSKILKRPMFLCVCEQQRHLSIRESARPEQRLCSLLGFASSSFPYPEFKSLASL